MSYVVLPLSRFRRILTRSVIGLVTTFLVVCPVLSWAAPADDPLPERNLDRQGLLDKIRHKMNNPLEKVATSGHALGTAGVASTPADADPDTPNVGAQAPIIGDPGRPNPIIGTINVPAALPDTAPTAAATPAAPVGLPRPAALAPVASPVGPVPGSMPEPGRGTLGVTAVVASGTVVATLSPTLENTHDQLVAAMQRLLGNPATLTVTLEPIGPAETAQGRFNRVIVHTADGEIDKLRLNTADIIFNQVHLDMFSLLGCQRIQTKEVGSVDMDIVVTEPDLNKFLEFKSKKIKVQRPKIEIKKDSITVSGATQYGILRASFWATGNFSIQRQDKIYFNARKFKINSLAVPRPFLKTIIDRINPILDLAKFPFKLNLKEIRIEPGQLHFISGK